MFLQQSNQVNAWDRMLADSGEKVSSNCIHLYLIFLQFISVMVVPHFFFFFFFVDFVGSRAK